MKNHGYLMLEALLALGLLVLGVTTLSSAFSTTTHTFKRSTLDKKLAACAKKTLVKLNVRQETVSCPGFSVSIQHKSHSVALQETTVKITPKEQGDLHAVVFETFTPRQ